MSDAETITIRMIRHSLDDADKVLHKFASDMESNPASALEWSAAAFEAAATKTVLGDVLSRLSKGEAHAAVMQRAQSEVFARSKRGRRSTSESANLMEAEMLSAWARAVDVLRYTP